MLPDNNHHEKVEMLFELVNNNIDRSESLLGKILGHNYRTKLFIESIKILEEISSHYKKTKDPERYVEILCLKSSIEKKINNSKYLTTLSDIADHYGRHEHYNENLVSSYYNVALCHSFEYEDIIGIIYERILSCYEKNNKRDEIIKLCKKFTNDLGYLMDSPDFIRSCIILADHYFKTEKYHKSDAYYDKLCESYFDDKNNKIIFRSVLSKLANNDLVNAKEKFQKYRNLFESFRNSPLNNCIQKLLETIDLKNEAKCINTCILDCNFDICCDEMKALVNIQKLYFNINEI